MSLALAVMEALLTAVPKIVALIRQGRELGTVKLGEVISTDALAKLERAQRDARDYIDNG